MNQYIKRLLLLTSILTLLASACDIGSLEGVDAVDAPQVEPDTDAQMAVKPTPKDSVSEAGRVITVESIQFAPIPPVPAEEVGDVDSDDLLSAEERRALLDTVNLGGPVLGEEGQVPVIEGPVPGTEVVPAPVDASSGVEPAGVPAGTANFQAPGSSESAEGFQVEPAFAGPAELNGDVNPEDIPSVEERSALLDTVNQAGPVLPGGDDSVGEGPAPGTESVMGPVNDPSSVEPESKTLGVSELLENPIYDTEIRVYGQVSLLGESLCPRFELVSGGKKVVVSCGLMVEQSGPAEGLTVSVQGIQNGDQVVVTGELKTAGSYASVNDFWASKIERAQ